MSLPPGPTSRSPLGVANAFRRDPLHFLVALRERYGPVVTIPAPLGRRALLINEPALIHEVLLKQAEHFQKPPLLRKVLAAAFGNGLLQSEGTFWRRQRRLAQPAFQHQRLPGYAAVMVEQTEHHLATWQHDQTVQIDAEMHALTLHIVVATLFGSALNTPSATIGEYMKMMGRALTAEATNPLFFLVPDWLPTAHNRRKQQAVQGLDAIIYGLMRERRASGVDHGDLLSMLLQAVDETTSEQMNDLQVRDELLTFFTAGHETTALLLTWTWVLLAQHPAWEDQLHAELDLLGNRTPTMTDLPQLPVSELIIKETLRLYPPAWLVLREAMHDLAIGPYTVRKGDSVWVVPYLMQRDPRFYSNPDTFDPARFEPDADGNSLEDRLPRFAYLPFGGGPRICIGNRFAMLEARLLLATIAQRYRLLLTTDHPIQPKGAATLGCKGPVTMRVIKRQDTQRVA